MLPIRLALLGVGGRVHCSAVGHGCPTLDNDQHRRVVYFVDGDSFYANLSCTEGHVFDDEPTAATKIIECLDFFWDARVPHCISKIFVIRRQLKMSYCPLLTPERPRPWFTPASLPHRPRGCTALGHTQTPFLSVKCHGCLRVFQRESQKEN